MGDSTHRDVGHARADEGLVGSHHVNHRRGLHQGFLVPATDDPVALLVVFHDLDAGDPLGLLHAITIGDVNAQREAVALRQGLVVPGVGQHDALVFIDQVDVDRFVKAVPAENAQVLRAFLDFRARQQVLQAEAGPLLRADQVAANAVGDAGQGQVLVHGTEVAAQIRQCQLKGVVHHTRDGQGPAVLFEDRRARTDVDAIVLFDRRQFLAGAGHGLDRRVRVGQYATARTGVAHSRGAAAAFPEQGAHAGANHGDGGRGTAHAQEKAATVQGLDRCFGSRFFYRCRAGQQSVVHGGQSQAPAGEGHHNPEKIDEGRGQGGKVDIMAQQGHWQPEYQTGDQTRLKTEASWAAATGKVAENGADDRTGDDHAGDAHELLGGLGGRGGLAQLQRSDDRHHGIDGESDEPAGHVSCHPVEHVKGHKGRAQKCVGKPENGHQRDRQQQACQHTEADSPFAPFGSFFVHCHILL